MIPVKDVKLWLAELGDDSFVAIDDGGLRLVEIDCFGREQGIDIEVGGIPLPEDIADRLKEEA